MSWVTIDSDQCNDCGLCALRCLRCFSVQDEEVTVDANQENCNLCGHCVALCPTEAIVHHRMDAENFTPVDRELNFDTDQFIHFVRKRRSHRHFTTKEVRREDLETLADVCRYAPTGSNRQAVELKIIQDPEKIARLSSHTMDYFVGLIAEVDARVARLEADGKEVPRSLRDLHTNLMRYKRMEVAREMGLDVIFYNAPVVVVFHSSDAATTPKDDCVIAAQTMSMTAMTMGLETCYIGLFTNSSGAHAPIREELKLPAGHEVYSTLIMGYPKIRFFKTVDRKPIKVSWE
jgi:nitroreductase/NAD-dependent dihydropyrimidine dehydrogenase PreA subunit